MEENTIKIVVVGDGAVGKTCMLLTYSTDKFPDQYEPTVNLKMRKIDRIFIAFFKVFDNYYFKLPIQGEEYNVGLFDTAGQEDYDHMRHLSFENADIFLICYSVVNPSSFANVKDKWVQDLRNHYNEINAKMPPFIIVGTQLDMRNDVFKIKELEKRGEKPLEKYEGEKLAKEVGALKYVECSALTRVSTYLT